MGFTIVITVLQNSASLWKSEMLLALLYNNNNNNNVNVNETIRLNDQIIKYERLQKL